VLARPAIIPVPPLALYLMYGHDMPRETLLVSSRVVPRKLEESGFRFRYPELEPALRHVLER
jgi:NAD dependent epimerase/dehydratase family enzyme